jgi:hydroxypyruvate isomerase
MDRRKFLSSSLTTTAAVLTAKNLTFAEKSNSSKFKLNYAPHLDMFKHSAGKNLSDQLKFIADQGFTAFEDNNMMDRTTEAQEKIAKQMSALGLTMGVFVAYKEFKETSFVKKDPEVKNMLVTQMKKAVETAKRVNAKWCTVLLGAYDLGLEWDYQTANAIDNLKYCAEVCEPAGLIMVLEPLNPLRHPGLFLTKIPQAYQICKAVNSPSCKILDDLYHQQVTEGNLIMNLDRGWDQIEYIQVGDNPGRKEPTTGEINYRNIFKHIYKKGYKGVIGMEHGNSKPGIEGETAVLEAYRYCDNF